MMEDKYNFGKGYDKGFNYGKKKGLELAISIIVIYDENHLTAKSLKKRLISHLIKEIKLITKAVRTKQNDTANNQDSKEIESLERK